VINHGGLRVRGASKTGKGKIAQANWIHTPTTSNPEAVHLCPHTARNAAEYLTAAEPVVAVSRLR
jgi:hypothetical protein